MLGDKKMQHAWMKYADSNDIPHDHEDEEPFKQGFAMAQNHSDKSAELTELREKLAAERNRREELEVVAAGLYLNHEEARHQMMMYKAVYIDGNDVLKEGE